MGTVAAATLHGVWQSSDGAAQWSRLPLPEWVTRVYAVTVTGDETLWIAHGEGSAALGAQGEG